MVLELFEDLDYVRSFDFLQVQTLFCLLFQVPTGCSIIVENFKLQMFLVDY